MSFNLTIPHSKRGSRLWFGAWSTIAASGHSENAFHTLAAAMSLQSIQPATKPEASVYLPYYQGKKRNALPYAIGLYKQGNIEGERLIEGTSSIAFLATWNVSMLPADLTRCQMQFDGDSELTYEITMATYEFVDFLISVVVAMNQNKQPDFDQGFYRKLLRIDE